MLDYHPHAGEDAIEPLLLVSDKPGRPRKYSLREILNAIFYVLRRCKLIRLFSKPPALPVRLEKAMLFPR